MVWSSPGVFGPGMISLEVNIYVFQNKTVFPSWTQCHSEEGLFPRCIELALPFSKTDKAKSVPRGVNWAVCQEVYFKDWL